MGFKRVLPYHAVPEGTAKISKAKVDPRWTVAGHQGMASASVEESKGTAYDVIREEME